MVGFKTQFQPSEVDENCGMIGIWQKLFGSRITQSLLMLANNEYLTTSLKFYLIGSFDVCALIRSRIGPLSLECDKTNLKRISDSASEQSFQLLRFHPANPAIPRGDAWFMSFDVMEEGTPCDYCGQPVGFLDDDWAVCPTCRAEYINMDFEGGDLENESPLEY